MERVRLTVASHYPFSLTNSREMAEGLLLDDSFACEDFQKVRFICQSRMPICYKPTYIMQPSERRFMAQIIVLAISQSFYGAEAGLAVDSATRHMFSPLRAETVVFVCCLIRHAIGEYEADGRKRTAKLEGRTVFSTYNQLYCLNGIKC
jgi:hypothetical protein